MVFPFNKSFSTSYSVLHMSQTFTSFFFLPKNFFFFSTIYFNSFSLASSNALTTPIVFLSIEITEKFIWRCNNKLFFLSASNKQTCSSCCCCSTIRHYQCLIWIIGFDSFLTCYSDKSNMGKRMWEKSPLFSVLLSLLMRLSSPFLGFM